MRSPDPRPCEAEAARAPRIVAAFLAERALRDRRSSARSDDGRSPLSSRPGRVAVSGLASTLRASVRRLRTAVFRRSGRLGPGSPLGRSRSNRRRRLRRSGRSNRRPGFGIRGRPTGIPTTDRPSGIPTIHRGPRRSAASGRPRRIGVVRPPGTGQCQPGDTRAPDRPSGSPIRRGLLPGIRDRPTGIHSAVVVSAAARRTGRSFDHCGAHLRSRRSSPGRSVPAAGSGVARAMIRPVPGFGSPRHPCGIPEPVPVPSGRRGRCTDRRIHGARPGTATVRPILRRGITGHRGRRRASCAGDRRGHGRLVGRRLTVVPAPVVASVVTAVVPAAGRLRSPPARRSSRQPLPD
jgi:hypothetical protein